MTIQELESLRVDLEPVFDLPFSITTLSEDDGIRIINNKIAIPIEKYSSFFKTGLDISVYDESKNEIGLLVFTNELGDVNMSSLTENQFIAFLTEAEIIDIGKPYRFKKNYLVLNFADYENYKTKYMPYAAIWGGFFHPNSGITTTSHSLNISAINAFELHFPADIFLENSIRAVAQPFAFERFLKQYHLLELRFDFDIIKKIQKLNIQTESDQIGEILTDYTNSRKEITRLEEIVFANCNDLQPIVDRINDSINFQNESFDLFFKYGSSKEGNPLKDKEVEFSTLLSSNFNETNLNFHKISYQKDYRKFILKLACYWIYRIRSSIAHNKIGEYILAMKDEKFIVEFGEPLLKEILLQCFKK